MYLFIWFILFIIWFRIFRYDNKYPLTKQHNGLSYRFLASVLLSLMVYAWARIMLSIILWIGFVI